MRIGTMKAAAGILGFSGVTLGAFGAHALKARLSALGTLQNWETAVLYHLVHAVALLALAAMTTSRFSRWHERAALAWIIGVGCFSGSLYFMSLGGPRWLWPITPLGGLFLLAGWGCLFVRESAPAQVDK